MCFSAPSSFIAAAVTGCVGLWALSKSTRREEAPLAAIPLLFAVQQAIEGLLWGTLPVDPLGTRTLALTVAFLLFAQVFWPVFVPFAMLLVEPHETRRRVLTACLAVGVVVGGYFFWSILTYPHFAHVDRGHIAYVGGPVVPYSIGVAYFIATAFAPALSSHSPMQAFAAIVSASALVSYFYYWEAFSSIWCFFAAGASVVILLHFERLRQRGVAEVRH